MRTLELLGELRAAWLPNLTDAALDRLIELLEDASPLLVNGCFTRVPPMGCLATHAAWLHPRTSHLTIDAGIAWLHHVAGLNPATSVVVREWDERGVRDLDLRHLLLTALVEERDRRGERRRSKSRTPLGV